MYRLWSEIEVKQEKDENIVEMNAENVKRLVKTGKAEQKLSGANIESFEIKNMDEVNEKMYRLESKIEVKQEKDENIVEMYEEMKVIKEESEEMNELGFMEQNAENWKRLVKTGKAVPKLRPVQTIEHSSTSTARKRAKPTGTTVVLSAQCRAGPVKPGLSQSEWSFRQDQQTVCGTIPTSMVATKKNRKKRALYCIIIAMCVKKKMKNMQKDKCCKDWLIKRGKLGSHVTILRELEAGNRNNFINYMKMDPNTFHTLLDKVTPFISKQDTNMRDSIPAKARLEATLIFLSTGCSYMSLQYTTRISKESLSYVIPETCLAIYHVLREKYLQTPRTPEEWKHVAEEFHTRWNFPNCIGAIDGKHILIRPPHGSGSYYYNYKGSHSIVLMAICDANSEFIYVDVGTNGHASNGGVWNNSAMSTHIANGTAGLPCDAILPGSERSLPFVFVADDAFPLQRHIMKPFSHQQQSSRERIFSYRVSRARRTVENAFGMLANRFRIFLSPINLPPNNVEMVVLACTSLHNFLRKDQINKYMQPEGSLECEDLSQGTVSHGNWRATPDLIGLERVGWNPTNDSKHIREQYMGFFNEEGAVAWQDKMCT